MHRLFWIALPALLLATLPAASQGDKPAEGELPKSFTNSVTMKLVLIPAGKFLMGSPPSEPERDDIEVQHEVEITRPFYMGVYTVTQQQWFNTMGKASKAHFNATRGGGADHPAEDLNWNEAVGFCNKLTSLPEEKKAGRRYRLPTEAEWEYACRAGTTTPFYFGKSLSSKEANFNGNFPYGGAAKGPYLRRTTKVGSYKPNAWGLYDMHGNVQEWCSDFYDPDYYKKSPKADPKGPEKGVLPTLYNDFYRVVRGGSWLDEARGCRSAYRFRAMPSDAYRIVGIRVVCETPRKAK